MRRPPGAGLTRRHEGREEGTKGTKDSTMATRVGPEITPLLRAFRAALRVVRVAGVVTLAAGCGGRDPTPAPRSTGERATTRAYDGAPPPIPHDAALGACATCHDDDGTAISGVGVAPASPHGAVAASGAMQRCRQCHAATTTRLQFVASRFVGVAQGPWKGGRATPGAPPTIPHLLQLREQCLSCHAGAGARPEIRTSHPERARCRQCHIPG
jgi:hypothetical protein